MSQPGSNDKFIHKVYKRIDILLKEAWKCPRCEETFPIPERFMNLKRSIQSHIEHHTDCFVWSEAIKFHIQLNDNLMKVTNQFVEGLILGGKEQSIDDAYSIWQRRRSDETEFDGMKKTEDRDECKRNKHGGSFDRFDRMATIGRAIRRLFQYSRTALMIRDWLRNAKQAQRIAPGGADEKVDVRQCALHPVQSMADRTTITETSTEEWIDDQLKKVDSDGLLAEQVKTIIEASTSHRERLRRRLDLLQR